MAKFKGLAIYDGSEETMSSNLSELTEVIEPVLKAANNLKNVGHILRESEKLRSDLYRNAFVLETRADKLDKTLSAN